MSQDAASAPRHPATEKAWAWLDSEEGIAPLDPARRKQIVDALESIDAIFLAWDEEVGV